MAKVSQGTVSKVLNDAPGVGAETRSRILQLIQDLDYHPDASARSLVAGKTGSIGVIIPHTGSYSLSSAYWPVLLTAITEAAAARNRNVLLSTARSEEDVDSAYQSILRGRRIDGLVVGAEQFGQQQLVELLFKGFPFVMVGKSRFVSHWHVDTDNAGGAADMTRHLLRLGHRHVALLAGPQDYPSVQERVQGYRQAMTAAGLEPRAFHCAYHDESATRAIKELLKAHPRTTALFVAAGDLVTPALAASRELGLVVPSDLALAAFDDHPYYEHFRSPDHRGEPADPRPGTGGGRPPLRPHGRPDPGEARGHPAHAAGDPSVLRLDVLRAAPAPGARRRRGCVASPTVAGP